MKPRPYQQAAHDAVFTYWQKGGGSPLVVLPTGSGKSAVLAMLARTLATDHGARVLVATHRKELITQDADAIRRMAPTLDVGIWSAGLGEKRAAQVTVGGVQSMWRNPAPLGRVDVAVVDEAHLVNPDEATSYARLFGKLRDVQPELRIVGLTATPYRMGQGYLTQGKDALFTSMVYRVTEAELVDGAYLAPLTAGTASARVNTDGVATSGGDWVAKDLELAADLDEVNEAVARDVADALASGRRMAMVFCVGVTHAAHMRTALQMAGVRAEVVVGDTPNRDGILREFKDGKIPCLVSCDVLTTGFDAPGVDVLAVVRPTQSPGLYVQIMGRGMRPVYAPGFDLDTVEGRRAAMAAGTKPHGCMVLDYGGNVARHGPITDVRVKEKAAVKGEGPAPFKTCKTCLAENATAARVCVECDAEFPPAEKRANATASALDPMKGAPPEPPKTYTVKRVTAREHVGKSGVPLLLVEFWDQFGSRLHGEFICVEHSGFAREKACKTWAAMFRGACPFTAHDAAVAFHAGAMREARKITVVKEATGYTRLVSAELADREPGDDDDSPTTTPAQDDAFGLEDIPF